MKILIIDDEPAVADLLSAALEDQGHETMIAHDGEAGLQVCDAAPPDAVFLDVVMPGLSGTEVLRQLRLRHPELPVLLVTGHPDPQSIAEEARLLGATDVIEKPFILKQVGRALETLRRDGSEREDDLDAGGLRPEPA
jgi:DNA-binding response OmpR family regulator